MRAYPEIHKDSTIKNIRQIRKYHSLRHMKMSLKETLEDTREEAERILETAERK